MELTWYGQSCFRITERGGISVVTDPFGPATGLPPLKLKADVVTISHDAPGHNYLDAVKGVNYVVRTPGEFEIGGTFITAIPLNTVTQDLARKNIGYLMQTGALTVLHLGDLAHVPDQSTIEMFGTVNILLVPVGGGSAMRSSMAAEVISLIEPNYIIPMHYALPGLAFELDPVEKFLTEMGVSKLQEEEDSLKVTAANLPEQPQVILLRPQVAVTT